MFGAVPKKSKKKKKKKIAQKKSKRIGYDTETSRLFSHGSTISAQRGFTSQSERDVVDPRDMIVPEIAGARIRLVVSRAGTRWLAFCLLFKAPKRKRRREMS